MRILSASDHTILNSILVCHPVKSSLAKLVRDTRLDRNKVSSCIDGLEAIGYVKTSPKNEIWLAKDGREFLGADESKSEIKKELISEKQLLENAKTQEQEQKTERAPSVLSSINELGKQLNKPTIKINNLNLKSDSLTELSKILSDDIADLLLDIKSDLERVAG